jgi:hypothetical protein
MYTAAQKHGVTIDSPEVATGVKMQMRIWYHHGTADKAPTNDRISKCLRKKHAVHSVGDS